VTIDAVVWGRLERVVADTEAEVQPDEILAAFRRYRADVRRMAAALKDASVASGLLARIRASEMCAGDIVHLPPEELLPKAKRARLQELRAMPAEDLCQDLPFRDEQMPCTECGKVGSVRYCYLASAKEGFTKAETWGSRENEDRGERCKAQCSDCLAEWCFEP